MDDRKDQPHLFGGQGTQKLSDPARSGKPQRREPVLISDERSNIPLRRASRLQNPAQKITLAPCPTCKKKIATSAPACPHCGQPLGEEIWLRAQVKARTERRDAWMGAGVLLIAIFVLSLLFSSGKSTITDAPNNQTSALDKMAVVFRGGYTRDQIEREASAVLRLFGEQVTDANYMMLSDVLVTMRKTVEPYTEMDILTCMKKTKQGAAEFNLTIPATAAICATLVSVGL